MTHFTTEFGRNIEFCPGYIEYLSKTIGLLETPAPDHVHANVNVAGGADKLDYTKVAKEFETRVEKLTLQGVSSRLASFYMLVDLLQASCAGKTFKKAIDIGCGMGIHTRMLKAYGLAEHVSGNDIFDRASWIDEKHFAKQLRRVRWLKQVDRFQQKLENKPRGERTDRDRAILEKVVAPVSQGRRNGFGTDWDVYNLKPKVSPALDNLIVGNIFDVKEKFDLVTSFSSFEWFEVEDILDKCVDLLEEDGYLFIWVSNWWTDMNVAALAGHFPWSAQRLTKDDYFKYVDKHLPDNAEALKSAYNFFTPSHPTLSDWISKASDRGLVPIRYIPAIIPDDFSMKRGIHTVGQLRHNPSCLAEVLDDIHKHRPDVTLADLLPRTHAMLFQKVDMKKKLDAASLEGAYNQTDFHYRPSGSVARLIRSLGVNLFTRR